MPAKQPRIAIIGAGPAGLTAAETLREQGYTAVTILERGDQPGGKCLSSEYDGKIYELGAGILTENNTVPLRLARKYGVAVEAAELGRSITMDAVEPNRWLTLFELFWRYRRLTKRFQRVAQPGWRQLSSELMVPYTEFAQRYGLQRLQYHLGLSFTGFGYSYLDTVPAGYILKYYNWSTVMAYVRKQVYSFPQGIQSLWRAVAEQHDVRYHTVIQQIQRDHQITITTNHGVEQYDALIISTPLDELNQFLDLSLTEQTLFKKIQYVDYRTVVCRIDDFPKQSGYIPANYTSSQAGEVVFWYHRHPETNLYTFYTLAPWSPNSQWSNAQTVQSVQRVINRFGGKLNAVEQVVSWKYFPHVLTADLQAGFYDQLEALQGQRHTYYIGEVMNFSCVGFTTEYAEVLAQQLATSLRPE